MNSARAALVRWFDQKYGAPRQEHDGIKVHLMCGVRTNVVTSVEIRDRHAADTKSLPYLVDMTAESFVVREVAADKAYAQGEAPRSRAQQDTGHDGQRGAV